MQTIVIESNAYNTPFVPMIPLLRHVFFVTAQHEAKPNANIGAVVATRMTATILSKGDVAGSTQMDNTPESAREPAMVTAA